MGEELKPCPFCGGADVNIIRPANGAGPYVMCLTCTSAGPQKPESLAVAGWNSRAPSGMAEPVAWRYRKDTSAVWQYSEGRHPNALDGWIFEPLYAAPPAAGLREENERLRKVLESAPGEARGFLKCTAASSYQRGWDGCGVAISDHLDAIVTAALQPEGK